MAIHSLARQPELAAQLPQQSVLSALDEQSSSHVNNRSAGARVMTHRRRIGSNRLPFRCPTSLLPGVAVEGLVDL